MEYTCEKCGTKFKKKSHYVQHINRKTSCIKEEKTLQDIKNRTCQYCSYVFTQTNSLKKHLNICNENPKKLKKPKKIKITKAQKLEKLEEIILKLNDKIDTQTDELKKLKDKTLNSTINIQNNIQQNIIVNAYGKEDLSHITIEDYKKILQKGCYSVPELIKYVHCNSKKPENRNIYIKNYKDDYILTFDGKEWNMEKKDDVFVNIIENRKNFLESKFDDYYNELSKPAKSTFKKFLERSDNNEVINNIKEELKNEFYKNRKYVKKK